VDTPRQTIAQATGCSRMLTLYCDCMMALHVEEQWVQIQVIGALTIIKHFTIVNFANCLAQMLLCAEQQMGHILNM